MPQTVPDLHIVLVVLALLRREPLDRGRLAEEVERRSSASLRFDDAAVRRLLRRLECEGVIRGRYVLPKRGPAYKVYSVTEQGVARLTASRRDWDRYRESVDGLLAAAAAEADEEVLPRERSSAPRDETGA